MSYPKVSSSQQWMMCNGSFLAQKIHPSIEEEMSSSKREGLACHEIVKNLFMKKPFAEMVGSLDSNGTVITQELFEAAREAYNHIWGLCNRLNLSSKLHVEERIPVADHNDWDCVPDAWVYDEEDGKLYVFEEKYGHSLVEVFENWQLLIDAFSIVKLHNLTPAFVQMVVIQPRGFHAEGIVRSWTIDYEEMKSYERQWRKTLPLVLGDSPICTPGPQCKTCTARAHCDALQRTGYDNIDYVMQLQTHTLSGHSLGVELKLLQRAQEMIKMRLSGLEEQALHEIKQGQHVPYFAAKPTYGRKRFRKDIPVEQLIMLGDLSGVDIRKPVEVDTPAQCIKKGIDAAVIEQYAETPSTGVKLEPVTERGIKMVFTRGEVK